MNVFVDPKPNCLATLRVELPPDQVDKEWQATAKLFQKQARIPGFRPGKAPQAIVDKRFEEQIREEVTNRLLQSSLDEAIRQKKLNVLRVSKVDDVEIGADRSMSYSATLITRPEFELPDYKNIEVAVAKQVPGDSDVDAALNSIAEQYAEFNTVEGRPLAMGDFAILTYTGSVDGQPLTEAVADCPPLLAGKPNWWIRMDAGTLAPGFCEALEGMMPDESRSFEITLPEEFPFEPLRGKTIKYDAQLHEIRSRRLPPIDDEFANRIDPGSTLEAIRERIKAELERHAESQFEERKRTAALRKLLDSVRFDLPAEMVRSEMTGIMRDIVQENQGRGVSDEELQAHENEIIGAAEQTAQERVRTRFVLMEIAAKEKMDVSEQEMLVHISRMAERYQIPLQKMVKDLSKRKAFGNIREQILLGKALDFISASVTVREPSA